MFCSEICRKNAFETFHRIECQIFSMFPIGKEDNISLNKWAAFRTLLVATKQGKELDQLMNHPVYKLPLATKFGRDLKEKFNSEDYSSVFYHGKRSRSNKLENYGSEFSLSVFVNVAKWLYLLRHTSFFGELEDKKEVKINFALLSFMLLALACISLILYHFFLEFGRSSIRSRTLRCSFFPEVTAK